MKRLAPLVIIIIIGIFLRFYLLAQNPPSLDWDEVSLGYNSYSILKTGADEYGNKLPLSIRSFDDYKPPLYVYLGIPSVAIFGLNEFSVRLPSAIAGSLLVIVTYFLVKEILLNVKISEKKFWGINFTESAALLSAFFVAISPWSLQFSRAAFEGNVGIFFLSLGILLLLKSLQNKYFYIVSSLSLVFAMYSYHSFRMVIPAFLFFYLLLFWKNIFKQKLIVGISGLIFVILILPIFANFFLSSSGSSSRLSMVTSFGSSPMLNQSIKQLGFDKEQNDITGAFLHNRRVIYGLQAIKGYLDHWNPDFLFLHGDGGRQHHAVDMGMLYLWDLPFIVIGIYFLARHNNKRIATLFIWFLLAPLASSITTGTPHPVRAIAMIPPFHIFAAIGFVSFCFYMTAERSSVFKRVTVVTVLLLFILNVTYYVHQYYVHTPIEYGDFWQYGNKEAVQKAKQLESKVDKIVMTYQYDQPYAYYLFYNKVDPYWYQNNWDTNRNGMIDRFKRVIGKYEFRNINWENDKNMHNTLFIGSPKEIPSDVEGKIGEIKFPDGSIAYILVQT